MDNSSRNIVKFIATITVAALIIMGARYYAESQKRPMPGIAEKETSEGETPPAGALPEEELDEKAADPENPEDELIEEDAELIMGEPSMNLEQGGTPSYAPPAQTETPPALEPVEQ